MDLNAEQLIEADSKVTPIGITESLSRVLALIAATGPAPTEMLEYAARAGVLAMAQHAAAGNTITFPCRFDIFREGRPARIAQTAQSRTVPGTIQGGWRGEDDFDRLIDIRVSDEVAVALKSLIVDGTVKPVVQRVWLLHVAVYEVVALVVELSLTGRNTTAEPVVSEGRWRFPDVRRKLEEPETFPRNVRRAVARFLNCAGGSNS